MIDSITSTPITAPVNRFSQRAVHPRAEHGLVVAQQQQEHRGARQQHAGERLHRVGQQAERRCRGVSTSAAATAISPA